MVWAITGAASSLLEVPAGTAAPTDGSRGLRFVVRGVGELLAGGDTRDGCQDQLI
jgi:hypothetical protein